MYIYYTYIYIITLACRKSRSETSPIPPCPRLAATPCLCTCRHKGRCELLYTCIYIG